MKAPKVEIEPLIRYFNQNDQEVPDFDAVRKAFAFAGRATGKSETGDKAWAGTRNESYLRELV